MTAPPQMLWWWWARNKSPPEMSDGRGVSVEEREFHVWRRLRAGGEEEEEEEVVVSWLVVWGLRPQSGRRATQRAVAAMSILVGSSIWWVVRWVGS